ncbi:MAG: PD40 domain-containing protein [Anaerolineae bacterium]|nr:PD40 domain-containing protein [Anaerolineae bacterium]
MLHSRRLFLLLAVCLTILSFSQIVAQNEAPTITPLPTETLIPIQPLTETATETLTSLPSETGLPTFTLSPLPSETPVDVPTVTANETDVETATASQTASETPTLEGSDTSAPTLTTEATLSSEPAPTLTLVASPSEIGTVSPTSSATASLTPSATSTTTSDWKILFTDNFDTGQLMLWKLGKGWGLIPSESGQALQVKDSDEPTTFVYNTLGDASVQMRVLLTTGTVRLSTRQSAAGAYSLLLDVNGQVSLLRGSTVMGSATISPTQSNTWQTIRLSVLSNTLSISIDGKVVITAQDATPLPPGTISVAGINAGTLIMDDVEVEVPNNTLVVKPTAQAIAIPSTEVVATPPNPNDLPFNVSDNLDSGSLSNWVGDVQDRRVTKGASQQLMLSSSQRPIFLNQGYLKDVSIQLDVGVSSGAIRLITNHSEAGSYITAFNANGSILLYRGEQVIGEAAIAPFAKDEMRTVKLQVMSGTIVLSVAGKEVIRTVDPNPNPLPAGMVLLSGGEGTFDNFTLSALIDTAQANARSEKPVSVQSMKSNAQVMALVSTSPRIIFDSYDVAGTGDSDIFMVNPDGTGLVNLTMNPAYDQMPSWSPDGTQIAFISSRNGGNQLYIMDVATRTINWNTLGGNNKADPSWSPDGQWIAYQSKDTSSIYNEIFKINVPNPTIVTQLTSFANNTAASQPDWSPGTGDKITFTNGFDAYLYRVNNDGTNVSTWAVQGVEPDYASDGRVAYRTGSGASATIRSIGTGDILIYGSPAFFPDWSPSGTQLVISKGSSNNADDLFIINANGSIVNQVTSGSRLDGNPDWGNGVATNPTPTPTRTPTLTPTLTPTPGGSTQTITVQVNSGSDDVNESSTAYEQTNSTVWVGNNGALTGNYLGLRFTVAIPRGATITAAHLEFYSTQSQWQNIGADVFAEASDNSVTFSSTNKPSQRTLTTAHINLASNVSWSAAAWYTLDNGAGNSNIASVIQEVVNRSGWPTAASNPLTLILKGTSPGSFGRKIVSSYEGSAILAPRLVITYSGGATPTPTPTSTRTPTPTLTPTPTPTSTRTPTPTLTPTPTPTPSGTQTDTYHIGTGSDDVNEDGTTFDPSNSTVWIGTGASTSASYLGLRFNTLLIPSSATITAARLEFYTANATWIGINTQIAAEAVDNSVTFSAGSKPSQRALSIARVNHSSGNTLI